MENKKRISLLLILFLISVEFIFAKGNEKKVKTNGQTEQIVPDIKRDYYIKDTDDGSRIVQQIKWEAENGAMNYIVHIEQKIEETNDSLPSEEWREIKKETVQTNELDTELPAGKFRYNIEVVNVLDQVEIVSDYNYFTILKAYQPEIKSVNIRHIYLDEVNDGIFMLSGDEFFPETKIKLDLVESDSPVKGKQLKEYEGKILECSDNNKKLKVQFDLDKVIAGTYDIVAVDVSGLKADSDDVTIKFKKAMDLDFYGAYDCSYMPGSSVLTDYFDTDFLPVGGKAGVTFIPLKTNFGYFGIGVTSMFFPISYSAAGYTLSANLITATGLFVYQKPIIKHHLYWEAHGGAGIMYLNNMTVSYLNGVVSPKIESLGITLVGGAAMQVYVLKRLYLQTGIDYLFSFNDQFPRNVFYPSVSIGGQL